ncbi:tripartite tricarboxylate transporter substrate binding protein [Desulfospira joergensenii]|uniref:tripartite tricarboxylate transporter substrate binding protein n=1 Tax=Desulfospira joergensenii TaxID=53329 RepID=UPI0003B32062|nr:tripartite tricarboxylate transporter substrate binding protein [Desulfospira joergensenii]
MFLFPSLVLANGFPSKSMSMIVPYSAGGSTDIEARILSDLAKKYTDEQIIVVNKTGGGAAIGSAYTAAAKPDGYTFLFAVPAVLTVKPFMVKTTYQFEDLEPLVRMSNSPRILVAKGGTPFKTFDELISYAKSNPKKVTYASSGAGTTTHIAAMAFAQKADIELNHVPYKGGAKAIAALLGGHNDLFATVPAECMQYVKSGDLKALAVFSKKRLPELPDVPTMMEKGINFSDMSARVLFLPKGVPAEVKTYLEDLFEKIANDPETPKMFAKIKDKLDFLKGEGLMEELEDQKHLYSEVLEAAGLKKY